jgi:hypothetical protein
MATPQSERIEARLARLGSLDRAALTAAWADCYGRLPPARISQQLLAKAVAYRWQEQALGAMSAKARTTLRKLASATKSGPEAVRRSLTRNTAIKPGTRFVREWHGRVIEVALDEDGRFQWDGRAYASLSAIAREVTCTRRNGPDFFGLREG